MHTDTEKRQLARVPIEMPIVLERGRGKTRDLSMTGVYFTTREKFSRGDSLRLKLNLQHALPGQVVPLEFQGYVVRVEPHDKQYGVAVSIKKIEYMH